MTSVQDRTFATAARGTVEPLSSRARRGVPLLVGAGLVLLLEPVSSLPLKGWVPVLIGLSYIAAGLLSGRRGVLLGPGGSCSPRGASRR